MKIEIVSHCHAKEHPLFAAGLTYQLSSLLIHPPVGDVEIIPTVCYCGDDEKTIQVIEFFLKKGLNLNPIVLTQGQFAHRCIGRNRAALNSKADLVWFVDCDHFFGENCFDTLAQFAPGRGWPSKASMIFPENILICQDWATGDLILSYAEELGIWNIDPQYFEPKHYSRAIGGVQIIRGNDAREYGYIPNDTKWQAEDPLTLRSFGDDIAYRKDCFTRGEVLPIQLPNIYRIRHKTTTYQADK